MARQLGLAPETLRYYERLGLLPSPVASGTLSSGLNAEVV